MRFNPQRHLLPDAVKLTMPTRPGHGAGKNFRCGEMGPAWTGRRGPSRDKSLSGGTSRDPARGSAPAGGQPTTNRGWDIRAT